MTDRHFSTFHIAGFTYYDGIDVYESLKVGSKLTLLPEPENGYDPDAIAIFSNETMLGYVPREENTLISKFFKLGYTNLFEARIAQINPETHPEKQVRVTVKIVAKK
jgi:hypothetical protein